MSETPLLDEALDLLEKAANKLREVRVSHEVPDKLMQATIGQIATVDSVVSVIGHVRRIQEETSGRVAEKRK